MKVVEKNEEKKTVLLGFEDTQVSQLFVIFNSLIYQEHNLILVSSTYFYVYVV